MSETKAPERQKLTGKINVARLCVDYSDERSFEAIGLLRGAGLRVSSTPVSGLAGPELMLGSDTYRGISEIKKLAEEIKGSSQ